MTLVPAGAQLAPIDLPPPSPAADPREPSPSTSTTRRGARTPVKHRSPAPSRGTSPTRPNNPRPPSSEHGPQLLQPTPKPHNISPSNSFSPNTVLPIPHHLSRPSSPSASIHSSTSAIFERDIEHPSVASLTLNPNNPPHTLQHKSSRLNHPSHGSALDQTVPAVLDDAVEAITESSHLSSRGIDSLEIEAPISTPVIGMSRQSSAMGLAQAQSRKISTGHGQGGSLLGQRHSRSPSPVSIGSRSSGMVSPTQSPPILAQLAGRGDGSPMGGSSGGSVPQPKRFELGAVQGQDGWGSMGMGKYLEGGARDVANESQPASPTPFTHSPSPPALPAHLTPSKTGDKRRISFISYNDLLLSVPTAVTPLGDITSGNLAPDHLPGTVSPALPHQSGREGVEHKNSWETSGGGLSGLGVGDGEWEREGLGRGLEQRLEGIGSGEGRGGT